MIIFDQTCTVKHRYNTILAQFSWITAYFWYKYPAQVFHFFRNFLRGTSQWGPPQTAAPNTRGPILQLALLSNCTAATVSHRMSRWASDLLWLGTVGAHISSWIIGDIAQCAVNTVLSANALDDNSNDDTCQHPSSLRRRCRCCWTYIILAAPACTTAAVVAVWISQCFHWLHVKLMWSSCA